MERALMTDTKERKSAWGMKILAFIVDMLIAAPIVLVLESIIVYALWLLIPKEIIQKIEILLEYVLLFLYFYLSPRLFGNTPARKLFKIKDKFDINWSPLMKKLENFPESHLKKDEVLKVTVKDGRWTCPSCNYSHQETCDLCDNCGQEISKEFKQDNAL